MPVDQRHGDPRRLVGGAQRAVLGRDQLDLEAFPGDHEDGVFQQEEGRAFVVEIVRHEQQVQRARPSGVLIAAGVQCQGGGPGAQVGREMRVDITRILADESEVFPLVIGRAA
jgi:hypothetical protein